MFPSLRAFAARSHQPLIRFIGRRQWPSGTEAPHPHPAAPVELREHFTDFVKNRQSLNTTVSEAKADGTSYAHFWEAPSKYWKPRGRELDESEMEAIMSGGASSYYGH
ncbi:hypothetical protein P691DRAFT_672925 [Macrolepiota fuliginosa MF-IS2]|uniref:Uncharacterized protein n=1 Tax=Macrolepiota fuliginosa MF-IS2 TaxID=1400762 RepID=A0A9P5XB21_9AGAR|nr:hypothetical protein P691DRAFT_672925 [Macrolepiota fuliginosa MF-IS2]